MTRVPLWDAPVSMGLLVKDCSLLPKCSLSGYGYHGAIGVLEHFRKGFKCIRKDGVGSGRNPRSKSPISRRTSGSMYCSEKAAG